MKLRFTKSARAQFLAAINYVRRDDKAAAVRFRSRAEETLRCLERFPDSGRSLPEFPELRFREVIVAPYRFFYRVERSTVWVVAVWHGARLPGEPD